LEGICISVSASKSESGITIPKVKFVLRDSRPDDLETLFQVDQQCFAAGIAYSRMELSAYIRRRNSFTLVAEREISPEETSTCSSYAASILGFLVAHSSSRGEGHVITIDVLPAFRRFGIGTSLLRAAEDRLRIRNCQAIRLETAVDNRTALSFYKRQGYYIHGNIPRYYPNSMDAFVLRKDLLSASQPATLRQ
jgi:ribosomal-protein-alanine N-acetyltransferase